MSRLKYKNKFLLELALRESSSIIINRLDIPNISVPNSKKVKRIENCQNSIVRNIKQLNMRGVYMQMDVAKTAGGPFQSDIYRTALTILRTYEKRNGKQPKKGIINFCLFVARFIRMKIRDIKILRPKANV